MPCCGASVSLNDLRFDAPAGFARFSLEVWNPDYELEHFGELPADIPARLAEILGTPVRHIWAHL